MSKARKLQLEVDSTLKKAHEGADTWEQELEKHLSDPNSKENAKQFDALKRDLKRLQKHREQIRGWLATGEVKGQDEKLEEARRRIESCMVSPVYFHRLPGKYKLYKLDAFSSSLVLEVTYLFIFP
jgi:CCR4-NOT transcriptional regulation complex NOT5 subunit